MRIPAGRARLPDPAPFAGELFRFVRPGISEPWTQRTPWGSGAVGSVFTVVATPGSGLLPGIVERQEPVLVQALGSQPTQRNKPRFPEAFAQTELSAPEGLEPSTRRLRVKRDRLRTKDLRRSARVRARKRMRTPAPAAQRRRWRGSSPMPTSPAWSRRGQNCRLRSERP